MYYLIPGVAIAVVVAFVLARATRSAPQSQPSAVTLSSVWPALVVAPMVATVLLTLLQNVRVEVFPWLALAIAPFCYATELIFVVPVMLVWPHARRPAFLVAVLWGAIAATCSVWSLQLLYFRDAMPFSLGVGYLKQLSPFWLAGGLAGTAFVWLLRGK
jgi:hypothetical protein